MKRRDRGKATRPAQSNPCAIDASRLQTPEQCFRALERILASRPAETLLEKLASDPDFFQRFVRLAGLSEDQPKF